MAKNEALFFYANVNKIVPNPKNQNKHTPESITALAEAIRANHNRLNQPIGLRTIGPENFQIIYGERRLRAVERLGWKEIPALLWDVEDETTDDMMRLMENKAREFDIIFECLELANLHKQGMTIKELANAFSETPSSINHKIAIGYMPIGILDTIRNGSNFWKMFNTVIDLLPLRTTAFSELLHSIPGGHDYSQLSYVKVAEAVTLVNSGKITTKDEFHAYVAEQRLKIEAENRDKILADQLAIIEEVQKGETEKLIKEATEKVNAEKSEELQKALTEAKRLRDEQTKLIGQMSTRTDQTVTLNEKQTAIDVLKKRVAQKEDEIKKILEQAEHEKLRLLGETDKVTAQKAQEIAKQQFDIYKKQTDVATALIIKTIEDNAQKLIEQAQIKTQRTIRDGITHFFKLCAELDTTINNLVLAQMEHMSNDQIKDVAIQMGRLEKMINDIKPIISDYLTKPDLKNVSIIDMPLQPTNQV